MKGGKQGRKRKSAGAGAPRQGTARGTSKKGSAKRPPGAAPRKGSRKSEFGGKSSTELEE